MLQFEGLVIYLWNLSNFVVSVQDSKRLDERQDQVNALFLTESVQLTARTDNCY